MSDDAAARPSPITYPAEIAVKAMGLAATADGRADGGDEFRALVEALVRPLIAPAEPARVVTRASSGGKYHSVSVHFVATSRGQLEAVYTALHAEARVLFTL